MNLNSISVTHHMIAGLWKIPEQYCLCCPILEYAIFTVFQTDKGFCQNCNPVFSPIIILSDNATGLVFTLYISCMKCSLPYKLRYPLTADAAIQYPLFVQISLALNPIYSLRTRLFSYIFHYLVKSFTHLYFLKCMSVHGIFPTSSTQVHAYTTTTGQFKNMCLQLQAVLLCPTSSQQESTYQTSYLLPNQRHRL